MTKNITTCPLLWPSPITRSLRPLGREETEAEFYQKPGFPVRVQSGPTGPCEKFMKREGFSLSNTFF